MEGEYQTVINRMGRATLGAFQSTPLGIVAAKSALTSARALLDHRQARSSQRFLARPADGGGPEEIPGGTELAERLRKVTGLGGGKTGLGSKRYRRRWKPWGLRRDGRAGPVPSGWMAPG